MAIYPQKPGETLKTSQENRFEKERKRDVLILIQHLIESQAVTAKLIIDCLYDIGSVNLINQKVRWRPLNKTLKAITWMPKPFFRLAALYWLKNSSPQIIANWLYSKVAFPEPVQKKPEKPVLEVKEISEDYLAKIEDKNSEVQRLRRQVRLLKGSLIGTIALFGGGFIWLGYSFNLAQVNPTKYLPSTSLNSRETTGNNPLF